METELTGDGVRLAATVTGHGDAGTAVLLPGGGQTRHAWASTTTVLNGLGWRTIALDLRGHGASEWAGDGDYSADAIRRDLDRVLCGIPVAPVVIGASIGGIAGLFAAGRHDPGIAALVLVDVATRHEKGGIERIRSFMTGHPAGFGSLEEVAEALLAYDPERGPIDDVQRLRKNLRQLPDGRWAWHWDPTFMWPAWRDGRTDVTRPVTDRARLRSAARAVRIPTLLVRGRRSDLVTEAGAKELLELIPQARYADVAGAGHMVVGHDNDRFGAAVTEFLGELETA